MSLKGFGIGAAAFIAGAASVIVSDETGLTKKIKEKFSGDKKKEKESKTSSSESEEKTEEKSSPLDD